MVKTLTELVREIEYRKAFNLNGAPVNKITANSKEVTRGALFVALKGTRADGHSFVREAIRRGAVAVVTETEVKDIPATVGMIRVKDSKRALAQLASSFYGHPSSKLKVIGITGTNGKTTTSLLVEKVLEAAALTTGVIGTLGYRCREEFIPVGCTTPDAVMLNRIFDEMVGKEITYACIEVSSHALKQERVAEVDFDVGVLTNLTRDHLDYHTTLKDYKEAKAKLFNGLKTKAMAVINRDDSFGRHLLPSLKSRCITYGISSRADVVGEVLGVGSDGIAFTARTPVGKAYIKSPLVGRHNMYNILAAVAVGVAEGVELKDIVKGVEYLASVPGRLEAVEEGQPFKVFVDYAHTDDALRNVLHSLRASNGRKLILVFGCGGDRDRTRGRAWVRQPPSLRILFSLPRIIRGARIPFLL